MTSSWCRRYPWEQVPESRPWAEQRGLLPTGYEKQGEVTLSATIGFTKKCAKAAIVSLKAYVYALCIAALFFTLTYYCFPMQTSTDQLQLFGRAHLSDALRNHTSQIPRRVQAIAESVLRARSDEEIASELSEEFKIVPLEIFRDRATMAREEIQLDVSGDPRRDIFPSGRRVLIPGVKVVVSIPYRGDKQLWHLQPNSFQLSSPRGTVHATPNSNEGILAIALKQPADEPLEQIKTMLDSRIRDIEFFLNSQRADLAGYDAQLQRNIMTAVADRRTRLARHDDLSSLLGIPEQRPNRYPATPVPASIATQVPATAVSMSIPQVSSWDVFVSHASEDKDGFARPLADALRAEGLNVWFDESVLRIGDSLRRSIDRGLSQCTFGIVIVSKAFLSKEWPQRELDGLVAREEEGKKVVLPIWHDITATEVRRCSPTLADRLAISSSKGVAAVVKEILEVVRGT